MIGPLLGLVLVSLLWQLLGCIQCCISGSYSKSRLSTSIMCTVHAIPDNLSVERFRREFLFLTGQEHVEHRREALKLMHMCASSVLNLRSPLDSSLPGRSIDKLTAMLFGPEVGEGYLNPIKP